MKKFDEILNSDTFRLDKYLKNNSKYLAHLNDEETETLLDHTNLVLKYFVKINTQNNIEPLIENSIKNFLIANLDGACEDIEDFLKTIFLKTVYFHDIGKINPNFQIKKMNNYEFSEKEYGINSQHSILSAYLFLSNSFELIRKSKFSNKEKNFLFTISVLFSHSITKHHSQLNKPFDYVLNETLINNIKDFYSELGNLCFIEPKYLKSILSHKGDFEIIINNFRNYFYLYNLLKINSSLLTTSDYFATNEFMLKTKIDDLGILSDELKRKIYVNTYKISYNSSLKKNFSYYRNYSLKNLREIAKNNLNTLRQKLSAEVITNFRKNSNKKLFYIEAPTGSGKTNLSLLILNEIIQIRQDVDKIFYVFPFTSLITQTYNFFKDELVLDDNELIQLHSKAPYTKNDSLYGTNRMNFIDSLFINYPFVLLSHIKFFEILTSNEKDKNYILHKLSNSVVILDELQSYDPAEWDKVNYLLQHYSETLNITFVLMSATLPKISRLLFGKNMEQIDPFIYLVENKHNYFNNPNFHSRIKFRFDYKEQWEFNNENLARIVKKHSEDYFNKNRSVRTIVEFITKNSAQSFLESIYENLSFESYQIFIITGTTLEPRRREIIEYLKSKRETHSKILIIATQVVEAGLDIDMDIGFKDMSIIDSEEQFAGRINRNATKQNCEVFLFKSNKARYVYEDDIRFKEQKNLSNESIKEILNNKDLDDYYSLVLDNINTYNKSIFAENLNSFLNQIKNLNFSKVQKEFQLIKSDTFSIFVPLNITKEFFTDAELNFLSSFSKSFTNLHDISGIYIWDIYSDLIHNENISFLDKKANLKILSSLLSKFTFSVWKNQNFYQILRHYGYEELGYFYLSNWENIYSYETGLKTDLETDCNFIL